MQRRENASGAPAQRGETLAQIKEYATAAQPQPERRDIGTTPNGQAPGPALESKQETPAMSLPASDPPERRRVVIANVTPQVDGGRYAVKRVIGDIGQASEVVRSKQCRRSGKVFVVKFDLCVKQFRQNSCASAGEAPLNLRNYLLGWILSVACEVPQRLQRLLFCLSPAPEGEDRQDEHQYRG